MKKTIAIIFALILMIPIVMAVSTENFEAYADNKKINICEGIPTAQTITITNTGQALSMYTLKLDGSAAEFTNLAPETLTLEPGESKTAILAINTKFDSKGEYDLKTYVQTTTGVTKIIEQEITIERCSNINIIGNETEKTSCPYTPVEYQFELENILPYADSFKVGADNHDEWILTTMSTAALAPGQKVPFTITFTTPKDKYGDYEFNLIIQGKKSKVTTEVPIKAHINKCYNFTLKAKDTLVCEGKENKIPITITNDAQIENDYTLEFEGPRWTQMQVKEVYNVSANQSKTFDIILNPKEHLTGNYTLEIEAKTKIGDVEKKLTIPIVVNECYEINVKVPNSREKFCAGEEINYPVTIYNKGMFTEELTLITSGITDVLQEDIEVEAGANKTVTVPITVPENKTKGYIQEVAYLPKAPEESKLDKAKVKIVPKLNCYDTDIDAEKTVKIAVDDVRTIPVIIENKGLRTIAYTIALETDVDWIKTQQNSLTLEPGQSEIIYLEATPDMEGTYLATIYAVTDKDIAFKKDITIEAGNEIKEPSKAWQFIKDYMYYIIAGAIILAILIVILKIFGK